MLRLWMFLIGLINGGWWWCCEGFVLLGVGISKVYFCIDWYVLFLLLFLDREW